VTELARIAPGRGPLVRLEDACRLLAETNSFDEVKQIRDVAEAARVYARQAQLGLEAQNHAAEIKIRAERRAGELLQEFVRPGNPQLSQRETIGRLPDGISRTQSYRWQRVASVPEDVFEEHVAETKAHQRELTSADVLKLAPRVIKPAEPLVELPQFLPCTIDQADASALPLPDGLVDLFVTSPPYSLGIDYAEGVEADDYDAYLERAAGWAREMFRVARAQGRLCLNVPLDTSRGGQRPVYADWLRLLLAAGWNYETTVIWNEGNVSRQLARGSVDSPGSPHIIAPVETIIVCSKGAWGLDRTGPHNLEHDDWLSWTNGLWTFPGARNDRHPAPFPEELPRRCISLFSFRDAVICDPFLGSGTTAVVAHRLGRTFYGFDLSAQYVALARARVAREVAA
jgi:site-specific DNA-methyltransferase (adenine-specific)